MRCPGVQQRDQTLETEDFWWGASEPHTPPPQWLPPLRAFSIAAALAQAWRGGHAAKAPEGLEASRGPGGHLTSPMWVRRRVLLPRPQLPRWLWLLLSHKAMSRALGPQPWIQASSFPAPVLCGLRKMTSPLWTSLLHSVGLKVALIGSWVPGTGAMMCLGQGLAQSPSSTEPLFCHCYLSPPGPQRLHTCAEGFSDCPGRRGRPGPQGGLWSHTLAYTRAHTATHIHNPCTQPHAHTEPDPQPYAYTTTHTQPHARTDAHTHTATPAVASPLLSRLPWAQGGAGGGDGDEQGPVAQCQDHAGSQRSGTRLSESEGLAIRPLRATGF